MSDGKLRATIVVEWDCELENYNAKSLEEAAAVDQRNYEDGNCDAYDLVSFGEVVSVKIDPVEGE